MQEKNAIKTCLDPAKIPLNMAFARKGFLLVQSVGRQETVH
jgi:hypothetical protein